MQYAKAPWHKPWDFLRLQGRAFLHACLRGARRKDYRATSLTRYAAAKTKAAAPRSNPANYPHRGAAADLLGCRITIRCWVDHGRMDQIENDRRQSLQRVIPLLRSGRGTCRRASRPLLHWTDALSPPNDNPAIASGLCYCVRTFPGLRSALASRQALTCFINMTFSGYACLIKV